MPNYVYHCDRCGRGVEEIRKVVERDLELLCECGAPMRRLAAQPTNLGTAPTEFKLIDRAGRKLDVGGKRRQG